MAIEIEDENKKEEQKEAAPDEAVKASEGAGPKDEAPKEGAAEEKEAAEGAADQKKEEASGAKEDKPEEKNDSGKDTGSGKAEGAKAAGTEKKASGESQDASRKKWKEKKKDKKDEQIEDLTDKLKRQLAEFDNYRKRTEKEKAQMFESGAKSIVEKILPIVDSFERGIAALSEEDKKGAVGDGMTKIYRQLTAMLEEAGVTAIECEGKEFDPNLHNAVMHVDDDSVGENIVVQELQKGYMYHDMVVRHSMVKVAN